MEFSSQAGLRKVTLSENLFSGACVWSLQAQGAASKDQP